MVYIVRFERSLDRFWDEFWKSPRALVERVGAPAATSQTPFDFNFDSDLRDFDDYVTFDLLDTFDWFNESWGHADLTSAAMAGRLAQMITIRNFTLSRGANRCIIHTERHRLQLFSSALSSKRA
jgi:hypothetical protein